MDTSPLPDNERSAHWKRVIAFLWGSVVTFFILYSILGHQAFWNATAKVFGTEEYLVTTRTVCEGPRDDPDCFDVPLREDAWYYSERILHGGGWIVVGLVVLIYGGGFWIASNRLDKAQEPARQARFEEHYQRFMADDEYEDEDEA